MGHGVQWSAFSMVPALSASPALASDLVPISPEEEWLLECVVLSVPIVAGKGFQRLVPRLSFNCPSIMSPWRRFDLAELSSDGGVLARWRVRY